MKKRNIVFGLIALEIISIPVSAKMIDKALHAIPQDVIATELPRQPGLTKLVINSNTPFVIAASDVTGELDVKVNQTGAIYTTPYGEEAQMPGPSESCSAPTSIDEKVIYEAQRRTANNRGKILSQSVVVELRYDADTDPVFNVMTKKAAKGLKTAPDCSEPRLAARVIPS